MADTEAKKVKKIRRALVPHHPLPAGGIARGRCKGYHIKKRTMRPRPVALKGKSGKTSKLARDVIREVAGFAPYEKRMLELLKNNLDKRALRLAKKRLGTHQRALSKREELAILVRTAR